MATELAADMRREFLRRMLLVRRTEEHVIHFAQDHPGLIRGHYHVYIGQEAAGVGVCAALGPDDYVFTTHRNHGHVLARGGDPKRVLAEIIGRTTGYNRGRGGTFHVVAPHLGILHTSAIVGGCVPLAVGAAFSIRRRGTPQVSLVFFGDGVLEEGAFYEGINMAALWKLPVIFFCENNSVPPGLRSAGQYPSSSLSAKQLVDIPRAFNMAAQVVDGADVRAVYHLLTELVQRTRKGEGPFFVEARISRWPGNLGLFPEPPGGDYNISWIWDEGSAPEALRQWLKESDPIALFVRDAVRKGELKRQEVVALDAAVRQEAAEAARFALESPHPPPEDALKDVFA